MTMTVVKRPLTQDEMDAIHAAIEAAETPLEALEQGVITLFQALMSDVGKDFYAESSIDGQDYQIPDGQWMTVCGWLVDRGHELSTDLGAVNLGLDFMNVGPSGYKETP